MTFGVLNGLHFPARGVFPRRHRRERVFIDGLADIERGELRLAGVVLRLRRLVRQGLRAAVGLIIRLIVRLRRWWLLLVSSSVSTTTTASPAATEAATRALSAEAETSHDAEDDRQNDQGPDDDADNYWPPEARTLATLSRR